MRLREVYGINQQPYRKGVSKNPKILPTAYVLFGRTQEEMIQLLMQVSIFSQRGFITIAFMTAFTANILCSPLTRAFRRLDEILAAATSTEIRKMKLSSSHVAGVLYCMGGLGLQGRAAFE